MNATLTWVDGKDLNKSELEAIAQIDNHIPGKFDPHFPTEQQKVEDRVKFYQERSQEGFFKVVYDEKTIVAFHFIQKRNPEWAYISTLWVHPQYRNRGIAKELKSMGVAWAKLSGFKFLTTSVNVNNARMHEINKRSGFEDFAIHMRLKLY